MSPLDDQGHYLAVQSSKVGLCVNPDTERCFIRMEFERHKRNYPKAHIQISGSSEELAVAGHPPKQLQDVHIPVGGVRYRRRSRTSSSSWPPKGSSLSCTPAGSS